MKVLVCGSRDWMNRDAIERELKKLPPGTVIIHGAARGADTIAGEVAEQLGFEVRPYPADWETHGRSAGPRRNSLMLHEEHPDKAGVSIDQGLAFTADLERSRGTKDMVKRMRGKGILTTVFSE